MKVTLSCDHRALDGVQGAGFLKEFKRILEHPSELLPLEGDSMSFIPVDQTQIFVL